MGEVIVEVEFKSAPCAFWRYQHEEVVDVVGGRNGWSTGNLSNVR